MAIPIHLLKGSKLLSATLVLLLIADLQAQPVPSRPVTLIDHTQGLISPFNFFMYKDSRDLMWIGSISGLYQYDGNHIKVYKPDPEDQVNPNPQYVHSYFCEDPKGNIWFGTWRGISCYIREKDNFKSYLLEHANPSTRFTACGFDSMGKLWFIHDNGIYTLDTTTTEMERQADIHPRLNNAEIQFDNHGKVKYVFCYGRYKDFPGLYIYEFKDSRFLKETSLPALHDLAVSDVQMTSDTSALIATSSGLYTYNEGTGAQQLLRPDNITGEWTGHSITTFQDSLYLIGTAAYDYYVYSTKKNAFVNRFQIDFKGEELHERPLGMYTDPDGAIWIHLDGRGVAYFNPRIQIFDHYPLRTEHDGESVLLDVNGLAEVDSQTVLATCGADGAYFIHTSRDKITGLERCKDCPPEINSLFRDSKGRIWMTMHGDLFLMEANRKVILIPRSGNTKYGLGFCELRNGQIIHVAHGKLFITGKDETEATSFSRLTALDTTFRYSHIAFLPDDLFYATVSGHDSAYQVSVRAFDPDDHFRLIHSTTVGWGIRSSQAITGSNDFIVGTTQGLYAFKDSTKTFSSIDYSVCGNEAIWGILPLGEEKYLLCGEKCISTIDLKHQQAQSFGLENGLGMKGATWFGFLRHSGGKIWLGHYSGISIVDPDHLDVPDVVSDVNISAIRVNDLLFDPALYKEMQATNANEIKKLRLQSTQNTVSFDFAAISYTGMNVNEFEYRMKGLEQVWVDGGTQGFARYVNLSPGKYTFEVRVKNQPQSVHTIQLDIIPPFYARFWFLALVGFGCLGIIYQSVKWRDQRKQRLLQMQYEKQLAIEHERLRISNNLHDDLGSGISALSLRARLLADQVKDPVLHQQMDDLVGNTNRLTQQIRETIWTINSQNDTVDSLVTQLHQYTLDYFEGSGVECKIHLMPEQVKTAIKGNDRREIYLAYKEALHNIYKHAKATRVIVNMEMKEDIKLIISIRDNGTGFDVSKKSNGNGLSSMQKRMEEIGGGFNLSSDDSGTEVGLIYRV